MLAELKFLLFPPLKTLALHVITQLTVDCDIGSVLDCIVWFH